MKLHILLAVAGLAAVAAAAPASAAVNLINNGSFENNGIGVGTVAGWTKSNPASDAPASIISYNSNASYPTGAFGEAVTPDNIVSASPDAVGNQALYFVGDFATNETLSQLTYLGVGNYRIGFSYYLTANGLSNINNSSISASIIGTPVAMTVINGSSTGKTWFYATGVANISAAGHYLTSLTFNSNGNPAKDVVIDRVFASKTNDAATVFVPPTPAFLPKPTTSPMLLLRFGLVGATLRRRTSNAVAA